MTPVFANAVQRLMKDNGAIYCAAIAFSVILALFPFLIFVTTLAAFLGGPEVANAAVSELFEILPKEVADGLQPAIEGVLSKKRTGLLTLSVLFTLLISTNAVNIMRKSLNRAYDETETRKVVFCHLQNFLFVLGGAAGFLILGFAIILGPTLWNQLVKYVPEIIEYKKTFTLTRYAVAVFVLFFVLAATHIYLPAGRRKIMDVMPGICLTLMLWLSAATGFSFYLSHVNMYIALYASLAGLMIAMVFFFLSALIFVFGAELNRALLENRKDAPS